MNTKTNSVFVDESSNLKTALQKLVNKLEHVQRDPYIVDMVGINVFHHWKSELQEAKKVLEEANKPSVVLCTNQKDVDLFDTKQLELPLKHEDDL